MIFSVSVLSKVLNLDRFSGPQIWNIGQEKDREKEKVGGRLAKLNDKNTKGDISLLEEQHENFVAAVTKWEMLAATNERWKWAAVKKSEREHVRHFLQKNV